MSIVQSSLIKSYKALCYVVFLLFPLVSYSQKIDSLIDKTTQLNEEPNVLLTETAKQLTPGKALDLGMGLGRNSIYLAMNGWDVTGVDMVDDALAVGLAEASKNNLSFDAFTFSKESCDFGINEWDLIVHVYKGCLTESRISQISSALKPGGILVFEFFHREAGVEMKNPTFGCETNAVKKAIEQSGRFNVLRYTEEVGIADYGLRNYKLVKLIAAKK